MSDSEAQQGWWDSLTPAQREDYEDGIARRKAEREMAADELPSAAVGTPAWSMDLSEPDRRAAHPSLQRLSDDELVARLARLRRDAKTYASYADHGAFDVTYLRRTNAERIAATVRALDWRGVDH